MADASLPRRRLLAQGAVVVAAGVAGFVVAREEWNGTPAQGAGANGYGSSASSAGAPLAPLASVPVGGGIVLGSKGVVLTRGPDGAVHGFSSVCTHQGCTVATVSQGTIDCPCHGSRFNALTGAVVAGPAPTPLPAVAVVVRGSEVYKA